MNGPSGPKPQASKLHTSACSALCLLLRVRGTHLLIHIDVPIRRALPLPDVQGTAADLLLCVEHRRLRLIHGGLRFIHIGLLRFALPPKAECRLLAIGFITCALPVGPFYKSERVSCQRSLDAAK
ncbi:hypothetical protein BDV98DRAFT_22611 [Pterulicium gracile]|uniref:Uncharacterized protein n=1 Tax=Pterulicium gracile TaxID=1884261 RepID=A0A5C3R366_9AGAR|nr:hypothetical protein BDV98DRAFT_22611 [Pterula gracilis]